MEQWGWGWRKVNKRLFWKVLFLWVCYDCIISLGPKELGEEGDLMLRLLGYVLGGISGGVGVGWVSLIWRDGLG